MTLYLKYRPTNFNTLVGQDFIKNTLSQSILKDKLVGAYLFCGPRGTGKTSTARIFAKTINCLNPKNGNPCLECEICEAFKNERLVDIIEIDAASYTGVDNIREIIEKAKFMPTKCKYKIYIIDEVHMLSKGAFNAFLKILEEPPKHLKFILATTEIHKIPETILSRCQRYDFKNLGDIDLKNIILHIAKKEKIKIDDESIDFIIKESNGGARNAISLFEQFIYNDEVSFKNIVDNYGIPKFDVMKDFYQKLITKDASIIPLFDEVCEKYNLGLFFKELLFFFKDKIIENIDNKDFLAQHVFVFEILEKSYLKAKNTFDQKTTFLVGIIKCIKDLNTETDSNYTLKTSRISIEKRDIKKEEKKAEEEKEITKNDLEDIFLNNDLDKKNDSLDKKENSVNDFDLNLFIEKLKELGAKGALTMSLRGSKLNFNKKELIIMPKTQISFKNISNTTNISIMKKALENIGFAEIEIQISF